MLRKLTRRQFLMTGLVAMAGAAASACGATPTATPVPPTPTSVPPTATKAAAAPAPTAAPAAPPPTAAAAATAAPTVAPKATTPPAPAGAAGGTLRYAEAGDFNNFSAWSMTATNNGMFNQVWDRLVWKDGQGKENLGIATGWQLASDQLSATVTMRQDVKWQDGKPHVAQDYVDMYNYTKDAALTSDLGVTKTKSLLAPVSDIQAVDQYTVKFLFKNPLPYFTELLDYLWAERIDNKADPAFLKTSPIGTGPFKMSQWVPNQYADFPKNPNYFIKDRPLLNDFLFRRIADTSTMVPNIQSGTIDGMQVTNAADVVTLQANKNLNVVFNTNAGSHNNMSIRCDRPPFNNKLVRQALSYSLNREQIAKTAFFGISQPIGSPFFSPVSMAYREDLVNPYPFNLDKAGQLLSQAGVKNLQFTFNTYARYPSWKLYALIWQADLAKIGVTMNVQEVEQADFAAQTAKAADWGGYLLYPNLVGRTTRDPAVFIGTQGPFQSGTASRPDWVNTEYQTTVAAAAIETDPAKRKTMYQRCNEILADEQPVICVATDPRIWAWSTKVSGVTVDLVGNLTLTNASISA